MPWPPLRLLGPFSADIRGVLSMRWLRECPHAIDGGRLAELLPGFRPLTLDAGLRLALERLEVPGVDAVGDDAVVGGIAAEGGDPVR